MYYCNQCDEEFKLQELNIVDEDGGKNYYCDDCLSNIDGITECDNCGTLTNSYLRNEDNNIICEDCADELCLCEHCGKYYADINYINNELLCDNCANILYTKCNDCGEYVADTTTTMYNTEVCNNCLSNG